MLDFQKEKGAAILRVVYKGRSNFSVISYDANNEIVDYLINTIGAYDGRILMDLRDGDHSTRLQVESSGEWEIEILPFEVENMEMILRLPATFEGSGDNVLVFTDGKLDTIKFDASKAKHNFAVYAWSRSNGRDLIVNEIAPYTGVVIVPRDTMMLELFAEGPWTVEIQTK